MIRCAALALVLLLTGAEPAPQPFVAAPDAPPAIRFVRLSATDVARGTWWSGRVVTGTNVASVVMSMPFFTFEIPRRSFGVFSFRTFVRTVPPLYRRELFGSITAYNAAGAAVSQPIAVTFR